jgi:endonuclease I
LEGEALATQLRAAYRPAVYLSYNEARDVMYTEIDNDGGTVIGRYTGYQAFIDPNSATPRADANLVNITAEHTWPQSKGADVSPMKSDMHHLFPTYANANGARGNYPFDEIPDELTDMWYRLTQETASPTLEFIDEYSELDRQNPHPLYGDRFEPREDHKGDVARAMYYFYTVYRAEAEAADAHFFGAQKDVLRAWHHADSVSQLEYERTCAIAVHQDGKVNPFVIDPTLVERVYFSGGGTTLVQFAIADDEVREGAGTYVIEVSILSPDPSQETTIDLVLTGGTATNGVDIVSFQDQVLLFPPGSTSPNLVSLTILEDEEDEGEETLVFLLREATGGNEAAVGQPFEFTLTIQDDVVAYPTTVWINEFHYDNAGSDAGEFVELAVPLDFAELSQLSLSLYNGSTGTVYRTYGWTDMTGGSTTGGVRFYRIDTPDLQNGDPDGLALDVGGELLQFLSYEGSFTPVEGPAAGVTSQDVGVVEGSGTPASTSISLQGRGLEYEEFTWATRVAATPGAVNDGQSIRTGTPVLLADLAVAARPRGAALTWATAVELLTQGFHVHRRSHGDAWQRITRHLLRGGPAYEYLDVEVTAGVRYEYQIEAVDHDGHSEYFGPVALEIPLESRLSLSAGPNPSLAGVTLRYELPDARHVKLSVYDLKGRQVASLEDEPRAAGAHVLTWDGRDQEGRTLASGVYFVRLSTSRGSRAARVTLLR